MRNYKSVRVNFIMNFILTVSNFIFPLITFPYASRILHASGIGVVTFATSVINYFSMFGMLGIPMYGIRACAKVRDDERKLAITVKEIMILNSLFMSLSLLTFFFLIFTVDKFTQNYMLYIIMSSTLLFNVLGVDWLYKALERYSYITLRSLVFKVISICLLFILVKNQKDYVMYGAITVFSAVGSNLLNFINLKKVIDYSAIRGVKLNFTKHIKPILVFFMLTVSTTIYLNVDTTLLGFIKGDIEVGYYSAAVKIKQILVSLVTSLGAVLLPRLSFHYEKGNLKIFNDLLQKALVFVFLISIPLVIYFIMFAKESILFLSGRNFLSAVLPMQLILPSVFFIGISNLTGMQILVPTNREKLVVISTVVGAIVDVCLNSVLIPNLGSMGAAISGSIAELSVTIVQIYFLKETIFPLFFKIPFIKIIGACLSSIIITTMITNIIVTTPFLTLILSSIIFFVIYIIVLIILREQFILNIFSNLKRK